MISQFYVADDYVQSDYFQTGIVIDWGNREIFVPKFASLQIQTIPSEVRSLDLDEFRLALKDLEDSEAGMTFPATHNHNTTVTVGGVTLARVIEIINSYSVTFEDGQYAINLVGANSNVGDVVNVNQVSVRVANSAGLIAGGIGIPTAAQNADAVWSHATASTLAGDVDFIKNIEGGRWKVVNQQMIFYAEDNVTELARFDLTDVSGNPTNTNVYERVRV